MAKRMKGAEKTAVTKETNRSCSASPDAEETAPATFALDGPRDLMVDGEVIRAWPQQLTVLPGALQVLA